MHIAGVEDNRRDTEVKQVGGVEPAEAQVLILGGVRHIAAYLK